jgi:selenoprotein W-related protein
MAQEIFITFNNDIDSLLLVPSDGGRFEIWCNDQLIFSRATERKFIEIKEIKVRIRNLIDPNRPLGHIETIKKK